MQTATSTENIYRVTCPLLPVIQVSGEMEWKNSDDSSLINKFSKTECLSKLREAISASKGQHLADYADDTNISRIDVVIEKIDQVEFYIHAKEPMNEIEIENAREDLTGQISDGWGEGFEEYPFNLYSTDFKKEIDISLNFKLDYDHVSPWVKYDATSMRALADIDHFVEKTLNDKACFASRVSN